MSGVATKITCPRCLQGYVIKVDAVQFCAACRDAICARCGEKFNAAKQVEKARVRMAIGPDPTYPARPGSSSSKPKACAEPVSRGSYHETPEPKDATRSVRDAARRPTRRDGVTGAPLPVPERAVPRVAAARGRGGAVAAGALESTVPLLWRGGRDKGPLDWASTIGRDDAGSRDARSTPWGDDQ